MASAGATRQTAEKVVVASKGWPLLPCPGNLRMASNLQTAKIVGATVSHYSSVSGMSDLAEMFLDFLRF